MKNSKSQEVSITPELKTLNLYNSLKFPVKKYSSVCTIIQRLQTESDKRFSMRKLKEERLVEVTRTA